MKPILGRERVLKIILEILENSDSSYCFWLEQFFLTHSSTVKSIRRAIQRGVKFNILHDEFFPQQIINLFSHSDSNLVPYKKNNHLPFTMHSKIFSWQNDAESYSILHTATLKQQKHKTLDLGIMLTGNTSRRVIQETNNVINHIEGKPNCSSRIDDFSYFVNNPLLFEYQLKDRVIELIKSAEHSLTIFTKEFTCPIIAELLVKKLLNGVPVIIHTYKYDRTLIKWIHKNGGFVYPTDEHKKRLHLNCIIVDENKSEQLLLTSGHFSPRAMSTSLHDQFSSREFGLVIKNERTITAIKSYIYKNIDS